MAAAATTTTTSSLRHMLRWNRFKPPLEREQRKTHQTGGSILAGTSPWRQGRGAGSSLLFAPSTDGDIHAVERRHPAVVVQADVAAGRVLVDAAAAHPVPGSVGQRLAEGLVVPAAQRHVAAPVPLLALLAGVVAVARVGHPQRVGGPHAVRVDDEPEVAAAALEGGEAARGQQREDLDQQVMREQPEERLRLQQLLQPLAHFQERARRCSARLL